MFLSYDGYIKHPGSKQWIETIYDRKIDVVNLGDITIYLNDKLTNLTKLTSDYILYPKETLSFIFTIDQIYDAQLFEVTKIDFSTIKINIQVQSASFPEAKIITIPVQE